MTDLISRQQAIDALCSVCGNDCDKSKFVYNAPQDEQVIMCPEHYALSTLPPTQPEPCEDAVSRKDCLQALSHLMDVEGFRSGWAVSRANVECMLKAMPPVTPKQPEYHEIGYRECADAVLKMWMDNVLTDGEHNRIIDKLNAKWAIVEGDAE